MINGPWKEAFHTEYADTEEHKQVTSNFGRHWFSPHFRLEAEFSRDYVQNMRGDRIGPLDDFAEAIDDYLHPHYEHIVGGYRSDIFKLDVFIWILSSTYSTPSSADRGYSSPLIISQ